MSACFQYKNTYKYCVRFLLFWLKISKHNFKKYDRTTILQKSPQHQRPSKIDKSKSKCNVPSPYAITANNFTNIEQSIYLVFV